MSKKGRSLVLSELIDLENLQRTQDALNKALGVATGFANPDGTAIARHGSWTPFCGGMIKKSPKGLAMCENCDRLGMIGAMDTGNVVVYTCHTGLIDFAAPIVVNGQAIGCFLGGQVATETPNRERILKLARLYELDEEELWEAAKKIPIVPKEQIENAANLCYEVSNLISSVAYQRYLMQENSREVERAANMKSDFLANMSHEIRTPMNAVIGMAEMALRQDMTPEAREYVNQIIVSGKTLLTIINDILDFSKIDSGKMEIHEDEYEPMSLVHDVANVIITRIGDKKIELILDIEPDIPNILYGDMIRINQIIINLTNNAVKFTQEGRVLLQIGYERSAGDEILLKVSVQDTGMGIKPQNLKKLFNSFYQVDSKRNRNIEGTGLGLAISRQLVELMGGTIHVDSTYGKGSSFSFEIPQKVVDPVCSIEAAEEPAVVAAMLENRYVEEQLKKDVERLSCVFYTISPPDFRKTMEQSHVTHIFVEKILFDDDVQQYLLENPNVKGVLLLDFRESVNYSIPNLIVVKKPVYALNVSQILNNDEMHMSVLQEREQDFDFIAPDAKILLVDDNRINLTVAEGLLEPLKMQIDTAVSGKEALRMLSEKKYDLIFMDHMMPEMDGVETTQLIRRFHKDYDNVPILALTANAVAGTKDMLLAQGMNDFVAKPIELRVITSKLKNWLPKDKIKREVLEQKTVSESNTPDIQIEGLDTAYALKMLGGRKLFWAVLRDYYQVIEKKVIKIKELQDEKDWPGYTIEVHALKSASRQIGAMELADLAAELEAAGNTKDEERIEADTDRMLQMYLKYRMILQPFFPEEKERSEETITDDYLFELFGRIRSGMDDLDMDQIGEAVETLSGYRYDDVQERLLNELKEANDSFDVERCEEIISEWESLLA